MIKLKRRFDGYITEDGKYSVTRKHSRIKGLYPKWYVSGGWKLRDYASTLNEAREIIEKWEKKATEEKQ